MLLAPVNLPALSTWPGYFCRISVTKYKIFTLFLWWYNHFLYIYTIKQIVILTTMTKAALKNEIKKLAKEENITFIKACQAMQGAAAKMGNEKMITVIHEIKMASVA